MARVSTIASGEDAQTNFGLRVRPLRAAVLCLAFAILLFSNDESLATASQAASVAILLASALLSFPLLTRYAFERFSVVEIALLLMFFGSLTAGLFSGDVYSAGYTATFLIVILAIAVIARTTTMDELLMIAGVAFALMGVICVLRYPSDILTSLNPSSTDRYTLRIRPFNLHPNLTGFMFSGGAILTLYGAVTRRGLLRAFLFAGTIACVLLPIAASARAGLLGLILSAAAISVPAYSKLNALQRKRFWIIAALVLLASILLASSILNFIYVVFELGSNTRGLDSGGSGRVERWQQSFDAAFSGVQQIVFGSGLRTAVIDEGNPENSYLNILIESGAFIGAAIILSLLGSVTRSYLHGFKAGFAQTDRRLERTFITWVLIYALIQSIFNRYLIAIGNPLSLIVLIAFVKISHGRAAHRMRLAPWRRVVQLP